MGQIEKGNWRVKRLSDSSAFVENIKTGECDWPIRYPHSGIIAYDFPERIPAYAKRMVRKIFSS